MASRTKRIVNLFYTIQDVAKDESDAELVSILKDCEMYLNISLKIISKSGANTPKASLASLSSSRGYGKEAVDILKHWIFSLSSKKEGDGVFKTKRNKQAKDLLDSIRFKIIKPPFDRDPDGFNLSEYMSKTNDLDQKKTYFTNTGTLKARKKSGRMPLTYRTKLQNSSSRTNLVKSFLDRDLKPEERKREHTVDKSPTGDYKFNCIYTEVSLSKPAKLETPYKPKNGKISSRFLNTAATSLAKRPNSKNSNYQRLREERDGSLARGSAEYTRKMSNRYNNTAKLRTPADHKSLKSNGSFVNNQYSLYKYSSSRDGLQNSRNNKGSIEKFTPKRRITLNLEEKFSASIHSQRNKKEEPSSIGARYASQSNLSKKRISNHPLSDKIGSSESSRNKESSAHESDEIRESQDFQGNFLLEKLGEEASILKITGEYKEAKLLEDTQSFEETGYEEEKTEKQIKSQMSATNRSAEQKNPHIIPFSEFMKDKIRTGHLAPSKIPGISKPVSSDSSPTKSKRKPPTLKKFNTNDYDKFEKPVSQGGEYTSKSKNNKDKYLKTLKNKFSPLFEVTLEEIRNRTPEKSKTRARQPKQQKMLRQSNSKESFTEVVKSQEQSRKNIQKVANDLKMKLKHNFMRSKERSPNPQNRLRKDPTVGSLRSSGSYNSKKHIFGAKDDSDTPYSPKIIVSRKKRAITTSDIYNSLKCREETKKYQYRKRAVSKRYEG
ncbi:unnamed protein product [Moneuplotes crassus]|uniref:Uncharacterized protein n=2 Tax=Euplotes crassus TaxID=5936 RepID=A0AAD1X0T0_EUPCR|nr:unnamed protein product [Moneuplotes crassus]